ncbi:MAG TPA: hypothetical protein VGQ14_03905 [Candidatus Eisenbacteria bacterium]|nr:hypothetical protein [Candidatus Eisenbacteria bacterium]
MSLRRKSLRALSLSFVLVAIVAAGFVVSGFARGEPTGSHQNMIGPQSPAAAGSENVTSSPATAAVSRAIPDAWLGHSGRLRAVIDTPTSLAPMVADLSPEPLTPGIHDLGVVTPAGTPFYAVTMLPYETKVGSRIRGYYVGNWPVKPGVERYAQPAGFIEVTPENAQTQVSEQFRLGDFVTHDQANVWPKFLVLKPKLLDKLELISEGLAARGLPSKLHVMSGFRTPQYNEQGVGEKGGRASLSRHMYGDASDVFVDADGDGRMDDLNGDGQVTVADARVLFSVAESVEAANPDLIGGLSPYPANSAHGPFVHVDTRGVKARW